MLADLDGAVAVGAEAAVRNAETARASIAQLVPDGVPSLTADGDDRQESEPLPASLVELVTRLEQAALRVR
jgi:hypothetical protein